VAALDRSETPEGIPLVIAVAALIALLQRNISLMGSASAKVDCAEIIVSIGSVLIISPTSVLGCIVDPIGTVLNHDHG
jgi:hypothetical protein